MHEMSLESNILNLAVLKKMVILFWYNEYWKMLEVKFLVESITTIRIDFSDTQNVVFSLFFILFFKPIKGPQ